MKNNNLQEPQNPQNPAISAEQVADYLYHHQDFFADKPSLLTSMDLIHDSGRAVSLIERQVAVLRVYNSDMRQRMQTLLDNARDNGELFEKTRDLILKLLDAQGLESIVHTLLHGLRHGFGIPYTSLLIYGESTQRQIADGARVVTLNEARQQLHHFIDSDRAICGHLSSSQQQFIFADRTPSIHSTAVMPLHRNSPVGLLAIGHQDINYFQPSMDTLFLSHIGDVLSRLLQSQ